jgi:hypothetical protein
MKLTISQAQGITTSVIFTKDLPVALSFKLAKLGKAITEELKVMEEQRQKLIAKYNGVLTEDRSQFAFEGENAIGFNRDMAIIYATEFEVVFEPVSISSFGDTSLTPNDLALLDPLILPE